jgi:multiple sugar transport system ATP-binding protein
MSTLSLRNINKVYSNNVQAVFDFNLDIADKEFIVLVGPSGCGKSTTLRMIAGLEDISSGELYIGGNYVNSVVPKDRDIAMVFQNYALYPHMTVYGNMSFALKLRKIPCPIYVNLEDAAPYYEKIKVLRNEIKKIDRYFKKHQDDYSRLPDREELYHQIYGLLDEAQKVLKPVIGIDEYQIKHNTLMRDILLDEIKKIEHKLTNPKLAEIQQKVLRESLEQKNKQVTFFEEKIEYYKNNEVPLYKMRRLTKEEIDIEVNKAAESIDLIKYLYRKPSALSGGQRQRVALGRAIVRKPKVFLMDEPLSNLDAKLRVQTRSEISKIHERVGATTVYVTHDQTEAMTMADRIVIMKDGYIQQVGTPLEIYNNPMNKFVAGFIGSPSMNFLLGKYEKGVFSIGERKITLGKSDKELLKDYEGKELYLGVRPEAIYFEKESMNTNPSKEVWSSECDYVELLGYELVIYTYIDEQKLILKTPVTQEVKSHNEIRFQFNLDKLYFFDKETEKRIK